MLRDCYLADASIIHVMTRAEHSYGISPRTSQQISVSFLFQIVKLCLSIFKMFIHKRQMMHLPELYEQSFTHL